MSRRRPFEYCPAQTPPLVRSEPPAAPDPPAYQRRRVIEVARLGVDRRLLRRGQRASYWDQIWKLRRAIARQKGNVK